MCDRLAEDHENARSWACHRACPAFEPEPVPTNMVFWHLRSTPAAAQDFHARCRGRGVWFNLVGGTRFRAVTHLDVSREQVERAAEIICEEARM